MNHVPDNWLNWIRRGLIVYSLHFVAGYFIVVFGLHEGWSGDLGYSLVLMGILGVHMLYETIASLWLKKRLLVRTHITLAFALIETFIIAEATGVYKSPYFIAVIAIIFVSAALGSYVAPTILFTLIIGFLLGLSGVFNTPTDVPYGIAVLISSLAFTIAGNLFWRRYYTKDKTVSNPLDSILKGEKLKSDIIVNTIGDGVVLVDKNMVVHLFNPAAETILGWPVKEAVGLDLRSILKLIDEKGNPYPDTNNPFVKVFTARQTVRDNNATFVTRANKQISLQISASPLLDDEKNVTGVVGILRDVSKERGEEKARAEFISTASHEMRTPVAAIEGYLALAMNDKVSSIDSKARSYLEKAHASTQHLGKLFQDLLTSAKAEDGRLSSHPTVIELGDFLEKLTSDLRFAAEKKGLTMEFILGTGQSVDASSNASGGHIIKPLYYVHADPDRLREVITNLFDNAVKYTESGKISLGLTGDNSVVQFYVRDTGPGIPKEDMAHLFQKFYRVDNSATRTIGGTGLGLFICRKIIELYNGRIWVESELDHGSTFFVNLPRLDTSQAQALNNAAETETLKAT